MGCCLSHSAGPNSPYPGGAPNASARHINPPPLMLPESVQSRTNNSSQANPQHLFHADEGPLNQHINRPLRRHEWTSRKRRWTRKQLDREREEFFDTRVTGRPEVWQTIHATMQVLWNTSAAEEQTEAADSLATAQTILDAAEISLPTGSLANGAYDALGNYYCLPEWIVSDPKNISPEEQDNGDDEDTTVSGNDPDDDDANNDDGGKSGKGKGLDEEMKIMARLSETGKDITVTIDKTDSVRNVVRKIAETCSLGPGKKIRLAYMGKMLRESNTLDEQGWIPGHIINALVFEQ